jgi:CRP/FNR family transcriptional regulator, cyclic AMP receptor protein
VAARNRLTQIKETAMNIDTVKTIPLFAPVAKRQHKEIARLADEIDVPVGTELTRQGGQAREFFIVMEGTADVLRDGQHIGTIWPNDFFGEVGMLSTSWVRTETVVAASPMRLLVLGRREFQTLMFAFPAVAEPIRETAASRQAAAQALPALRTDPTSVQRTTLAPTRSETRTSRIDRARRVFRRSGAGQPNAATL